LVWWLDGFVMRVLNAKPKPKDVAIAKIINVDFFHLSVCICAVALRHKRQSIFIFPFFVKVQIGIKGKFQRFIICQSLFHRVVNSFLPKAFSVAMVVMS